MKELIILLNFNTYQGGGETLLLRFAKYLRDNKIDFLIFCSENSFIHNELKKIEYSECNFHSTNLSYDLPYLSEKKKKQFIDDLSKTICKDVKARLVSFCMRDLYAAFLVSRELSNSSISHLILHIQDNLFLGQTLWDKFQYISLRARNFTNKKNIKLNRLALTVVNKNGGLISMAQIINDFWLKSFKFLIPNENVVPLPSFRLIPGVEYKLLSNKRIIWIGRIVDFKIPSIIAMIEFVSSNENYSLTIVGDGDRKVIFDYVDSKSLDISRVSFLGEVPYQELGDVIKGHSIGYAMGTSLIELAMFKIPVIVALASYDHELFVRQICGGIFFNKQKGCDGSDLMLNNQSDIKTTISEMIYKIEFDYLNISKRCHEFAERGFSETDNFEAYFDIIKQSKIMSKLQKNIDIPKASYLRKLFYELYNKFAILIYN